MPPAAQEIHTQFPLASCSNLLVDPRSEAQGQRVQPRHRSVPEHHVSADQPGIPRVLVYQAVPLCSRTFSHRGRPQSPRPGPCFQSGVTTTHWQDGRRDTRGAASLQWRLACAVPQRAVPHGIAPCQGSTRRARRCPGQWPLGSGTPHWCWWLWHCSQLQCFFNAYKHFISTFYDELPIHAL